VATSRCHSRRQKILQKEEKSEELMMDGFEEDSIEVVTQL
jgi:hypothetical protein